MIRQTILTLGLLGAAGCSAIHKSSKAAPLAEPAKENVDSLATSLAVADALKMPSCDGSHEGQLVYVVDVKQFKTCLGGSWQDISITGAAGKDGAAGKEGLAGKDGAAGKEGLAGDKGLTIKALYDLSSPTTDLCTRWSNIICIFRGGTFIVYTNGLKYADGGISSSETYTITGSGVNANQTDTDTVIADTSIYANAPTQNMTAQLFKIARTGADTNKQLWLVLNYDTDAVTLVFDTNGNGTIDASDEVVETIQKRLIF